MFYDTNSFHKTIQCADFYLFRIRMVDTTSLPRPYRSKVNQLVQEMEIRVAHTFSHSDAIDIKHVDHLFWNAISNKCGKVDAFQIDNMVEKYFEVGYKELLIIELCTIF